MNEHKIQNLIRNALVGAGMFFRVNVGQGWTGDEVEELRNGDMLIKNPRPFNTGLPKGFSDIFGLVPVTITPEMVGSTLAVFTAIEVKTATGRVSEIQGNFLGAVHKNGGRAGVARSAEDALKIVRADK